MRTVLITVTILMIPLLTLAATVQVPADQPTIQAGIGAALESDTVLISPGTYTGDGNRDIEFGGKEVVIRTVGGPEVTIIDCEGSASEPHRGFYLHGHEGPGAVIEGLTVVNGYAQFGGGIRLYFSSPTINNSKIADCFAFGSGGGLWCSNGDPQFNDVLFAYNECDGGGGGASFEESQTSFTDCEFRANEAGGAGAFLLHNFCDAVLIRCLLVGNTVNTQGGAATLFGGCSALFDECVLAGNQTSPTGKGGAVWASDVVHVTFLNCTVAGNHAGARGSAVAAWAGALIDGEKSIIAFNEGAEGVYIDETDLPGYPASAAFTCFDIFGNEGGDWTGAIADQLGIDGNFSADPVFCAPEIGNYHIARNSPCTPFGNDCFALIGALPQACGPSLCGDVGGDGVFDFEDVQLMINYYFGFGGRPPSLASGDMDCNDYIDMADVIMLAGYYYGYGPPPCCAAQPKFIDLDDRGRDGGPGL